MLKSLAIGWKLAWMRILYLRKVNDDSMVKLLTITTEEGKKVGINEGQTFLAIYMHIANNEGA